MRNPRLTHSTKAQFNMELRFHKMFFWCYANLEYEGNQYGHLRSFVSDMEIAVGWRDGEFDAFYYQWLNKVDLLMPEIKEISLHLIHSPSLRCKSSTSREIHEFLDIICKNLEVLFSCKAQMFVPVKEKIELLQEKLKVSRDLVKFTAERCSSQEEELKDFRAQAQAWANRVASLLFLYWVDQNEAEAVSKLQTLLLQVLEIRPFTPAVKSVLLGVLRASKSLPSETFRLGNVVANCVDLLLEDLTASTEDSVKMSLRDGLIILTTFLMDPPMESADEGNQTLAKAAAVVEEATSHISFLCGPEEKEGIPDERYGLLIDDFLEMISILKAEIREHYVRIEDLSSIDFPRTNFLGFIDFLLENLKEKASSISFAKFLILGMEEKLLSVRAHLNDLVEQKNEIQEFRNLWIRIIKVTYAVEHVIDSCFFGDDTIWHKMISLSFFKDEIESTMTVVKKIRDEFVNNVRFHGVETDSSCSISKHVKTSRFNEPIVGFKKEATEIIDQLIRGSGELKVVSIVGMPGQGKTTLANKIYNDPSVKYYFYKRAWGFVSQAYKRKELLLNILNGVTEKQDIYSMSVEDLLEKLYKSLKGKRYLVVMDDIWDIEAWDELKESFPNDSNGSRIIFTSRIHGMASRAKLGSSTHPLCRLSVKEGWELLQKKLFNEDCCPPYLSEVGMRIAEICEGLPLSIVVTSGLLARRVTDLDWWKEIEGDLSSKILHEGCMNILELSYEHLPDTLKACFLYFGAFRRGKPVNARRLTQLWVSEGFIPKIGVKRPEDLAEDFLRDLIDRSLVIVAKISSSMGIKECRVHDLLFDLCLAKIEEDNFLRLLKDSQYYPPNMEYRAYRLSIHTRCIAFLESNPSALCARTLLLEGDMEDFLRSDDLLLDADPFMDLKFLRLLDFKWHFNFIKFPEGLTSLVHLRHLVLDGFFSNLDKLILPPSIENLKKLEVLRVGGVAKVFIPDSIWNMKRLKHIRMWGSAKFSLGNHPLERAKLANVCTLTGPVLCRCDGGEELLRRFPNIQKLRIRLCEHHSECSQLPALGFLSNLQSLNVGSIKRIYSFGDSEFPSTLKKLGLSWTYLSWCEISVIGKLPNLEVLKLCWVHLQGERWDVQDEEFLNLKFLKLNMPHHIREWNTCADPFPRLQRLVLHYCSNLREIPSNLGEIPSLNVIEVHGCSKGAENSARKILQEGLDLGNDGLQVLISHEY